MIVQPIESLYEECGNRVLANKKRIALIKEIGSSSKLDNILELLETNLSTGNLDKVYKIIVNELFYEIVPSGLITLLYNAYNNVKDKSLLINELKESYIIRGAKSAVFAWTPILTREIH